MTKSQKVFTLIVALLPVLSVYRSLIPGMDLGSFCILLYFLISLVKKSKLEIQSSKLNLLLVYIIIGTPLLLVSRTVFDISIEISIGTILTRYAKIVVLLLLVFTFGLVKGFNTDVFSKYMRIVVYFCGVFILVQKLAYMGGYIINNPFLNLATYEGYTDGTYTMVTGSLFRPSAIFLEPAHMSVYLLSFLCYSLFSKEKNKNRPMDILITMIGIYCTGSGIGLVVSLGILLLCCFKIFAKNPVYGIAMIVVLCVAGFILVNIESIQMVLARLLTDNVSGGGNAIAARIGDGYTTFWNSSLAVILFGRGFGNVPLNEYYNGVTYLLNTMGLLGTACFLGTALYSIRGNELWKKVVILVYVILLFGAQLFTVSSLVFYFSMLYRPVHKRESYADLRYLKKSMV